MTDAQSMSEETPRRKGGHLSGFGALLGSSFFSRVLGLAKLLVFAPVLGPAAFGAFRLAMTASNILGAFGGLGLQTCYLRYLPEETSPHRRFLFVRLMVLRSCVASLVLGAVLLLFAGPLTRAMFSSADYRFLTILVIVSIPLFVLYQSAIGIARGLGAFGRSARGEVMMNVLQLAVALGGFVLVAATDEVAFGAYLVGLAVAAWWLFGGLVPRGPMRDESSVAHAGPTLGARALRYSLWYAVIPAFQYLFDFMDRWALARFRGMEEAGVYSLVPVLAGGMTIFGLSMSAIAAQRGASLRAAGDRVGSEALVWSGIAIALAFSLGYAFLLRLSEPLVWFVFGERWAAGSAVLPILASYFVLFNVYYILGTFASLQEATWVHLLALGAGGASNVLLNLAWVPTYGMQGAAWATLASLLLTMAVHIFFLLRWRIAIPGRFWLYAVLGLSVALPFWLFAAVCLVAAFFAVFTRVLIVEQDRRLLAEWVGSFGIASRRPA